MMGFRDPNADETYWAEYWDEFLQDNGVAEYVKARYQDGGNLRNCYDTPESWSASIHSLEVDAHLERARSEYREALDRLAGL